MDQLEACVLEHAENSESFFIMVMEDGQLISFAENLNIFLKILLGWVFHLLMFCGLNFLSW